MGLIIKMIVTLLAFSMFFLKREQKLAVMLIYGICFSSVQARYLIPPMLFFLSEIPYWRDYVKVIKKYHLTVYIAILLGSSILLIINSPHLRSAGQLLLYLRNELVLKYLLILVPLVSLTNKRALSTMIRAITVSMIILTIFGIYNLVTHHADFIDWILEGKKLTDVMEDAGGKFELQERFRVQAMHFNPFDYGFICVAVWCLFIFLRRDNFIDKIHFLLISLCCLFGVAFCGCRTIPVCLVICFGCYYFFAHSIGNGIRWAAAISLMSLFLYYNVPMVEETVNAKLLSIFDDSSDVSGSSLSMRILQFVTTISYIQGAYLFGRGYSFFNIDLGWSEGKSGAVDPDLYGLEGIYLSLLLERGVVGLILYSVMIFILIRYFLSFHETDKNSSAYCFSLITSYLVFAIMTGELLSAYITFLMLGIGIKLHSMKVHKLI